MKITTHNQTGEVVCYPATNPTTRPNITIREVETIPTLTSGQRLKWVPTDSENPRGPGELTVEDIPVSVPNEIPMWRARAIMRTTPHGDDTLYDAVLAAVAALPEPDKIIAEETLNGTVLARNSALLQSLASGLGLSPEDVDDLILAALQLPG